MSDCFDILLLWSRRRAAHSLHGQPLECPDVDDAADAASAVPSVDTRRPSLSSPGTLQPMHKPASCTHVVCVRPTGLPVASRFVRLLLQNQQLLYLSRFPFPMSVEREAMALVVGKKRPVVAMGSSASRGPASVRRDRQQMRQRTDAPIYGNRDLSFTRGRA